MDEKKQPVEFDPVGEHSRQSFWQIYLPLALAGIAALACIFFLLKSSQVGTADLRVWADISVIFMILPALFLILLWLILNLVGSFAVHKISVVTHEKLSALNRLVSRLSGWIIAAMQFIRKVAIDIESCTSLLSKKQDK